MKFSERTRLVLGTLSIILGLALTAGAAHEGSLSHWASMRGAASMVTGASGIALIFGAGRRLLSDQRTDTHTANT